MSGRTGRADDMSHWKLLSSISMVVFWVLLVIVVIIVVVAIGSGVDDRDLAMWESRLELLIH